MLNCLMSGDNPNDNPLMWLKVFDSIEVIVMKQLLKIFSKRTLLKSFALFGITMLASPCLAQWTPVTINPTGATTLKAACNYRYKIGQRYTPSKPVYYSVTRTALDQVADGTGTFRAVPNAQDLTNLPEAQNDDGSGNKITLSSFVASTLKFNYESIELWFGSSKYSSGFGVYVYYLDPSAHWVSKGFVFPTGSFALEQNCPVSGSSSSAASY